MELDKFVKLFCTHNNISLSEVARRLNMSPQAFTQKVNRGTLSIDDLQNIALVVGGEFECRFICLNGAEIDLRKG